ncbi:MAG: hypothetical protein QM638_04780, partial [Nocardioides sp.]|uniref:hypothetical protein n=1 Tax=Nocardioides sp. TaxID=35761 RepID=UPI0039E61DB7
GRTHFCGFGPPLSSGLGCSLGWVRLVALGWVKDEFAEGLAGLLLHIRRFKMNQEAHGEVVAIVYRQHAATTPLPRSPPDEPFAATFPAGAAS